MSSLVEVEPYSLAVAEPGSPAEQSESRRETNLLQLAWQSRWLILLCMLVGAGVAWVMLQRVTPLYPAQSRIYVDRATPSIMNNEAQLGQPANYVYTQA